MSITYSDELARLILAKIEEGLLKHARKLSFWHDMIHTTHYNWTGDKDYATQLLVKVHESYGLTLVEAMQGGLPVLASDHYGVEEILAPEYGRTVEYGRASKRAANLEAALRELLADDETLRRMGELAREAARKMAFSDSAARLLKAAREVGDEIAGGRAG